MTSLYLSFIVLALWIYQSPSSSRNPALFARCNHLNAPAPLFYERERSDRFEPAQTKPLRLRNARIWTGRVNGTQVIQGDVVIADGIIKLVGHGVWKKGVEEVDLKGAWVTPGLVDLHSHIGVSSIPSLTGSSDGNSHNGPILPFLKSIDGLNTHDESYQLAIAGGVTTAQVLPGSANNIGGQAFVIKLRQTSERSAISRVIEPPYTLWNSTRDVDFSLPPRWRHIKHACGENPDRRYGQTRMDAAWQYRNAYNQAKKVKIAQDEFCSRVLAGDVLENESFPESPLEVEALVDVLRGRVKLSIHCYEAVDLDMIVRLSNEFKFPIASLHHAGETYLVPDVLKRAWGGTPAIALFAANARKKREAYRNSEFAPKILADNNIPVVMKSDHPVLNSRHLLYEAQQAHYYGLDAMRALASVTTTPAKAAGLAHRIGYLSKGYDADVVVWDSHPLALGATPRQVYIDGIPQFDKPHITPKPADLQTPPKTPDFTREAADTLKYEGTPPLEPRRLIQGKQVTFTGVKSMHIREGNGVKTLFPLANASARGDRWTVVIRDGRVACYTLASQEDACPSFVQDEVVDLDGGSLSPGLTTFGSSIGLVEIALEPSTNDGPVIDPFSRTDSSLFSSATDTIVHAKDALQFGGRNTLLAHRGGVTQAVVPPVGSGFVFGYSTAFSTGARHALEKGAIIQNTTALHITLNKQQSVGLSTQIAALRRSLLPVNPAASLVRKGTPLIVHVDSADIMTTLIELKREYDETTGENLELTFAGGSEAHLLADEISQAKINVILAPSRPFPRNWDRRRILPGPPLSAESQISYLLRKGVNVAIGTIDEFDARNARFDAGWAAISSGGSINEAKAIGLVSVNLENALGVKDGNTDMVAFRGGDMFSFESKVVAVVSRRRGVIELF